MKSIFALLMTFIFTNISASEIGSQTGLKIPRYVSIKSDDANLRVGPSTNYPIKLKYIIKNYPLLIIEEHKNWRKVTDFESNIGWMHKSLIKGERNGILKNINDNNVLVYNSVYGKTVGEIKQGYVIELKKCKLNWCFIKKDRNLGWVSKKNIWGVSPKEIFNIGYHQKLIDLYYKSINQIENSLK